MGRVAGGDPRDAATGPYYRVAMARSSAETGSRILRAAARGAVAAMAMTGVRNLAKGLGLIQSTPPERIVAELEDDVAGALGPVPQNRRRATIELFHWAYGAGGGVVFALLPAALRRRRWAGPAYGVVVWAGFAAVIQPMLSLPSGRQGARDELVFLADHVLYGAIVAGDLRPPAR